MGNAERNQEHLGIDSNVLVAFLDREHPRNPETKKVGKYKIAINPTIIHETFHTLVYKQKWLHNDAKVALSDFMDLESVIFLNQTKAISKAGLDLGAKHRLKGRDSLIIANFLLGDIPKFVTYDSELLAFKETRKCHCQLLVF